MNVADVVDRLIRRRRWLFAALVLAVLSGIVTGYSPKTGPLRLQQRGIEFGAASVQVLVDGDPSPLNNAAVNVKNFSDRARVYSELFKSDSVRFAAARAVGTKPEDLSVSSIVASNGGASELAAAAIQRSAEIRDEGAKYQVLYRVDRDSPIVQLFTQAPTGPKAIRLADAAAAAAASLVTDLHDADRPNQRVRRVILRPLGRAFGGTVNNGASLTASLLAGTGTLVALCILILLLDGSSKRRARAGIGARASAHKA